MNVEPQEVEAILEATGVFASKAGRPASAEDVCARDFAEPRRFSDDARAQVTRAVRIELKNLEREFEAVLREAHTFELTELREITAENLFSDLQAPFAIARFQVDGQPGWIQWEVVAAIRTIEVVLGAAEPPEAELRALSPVERKVLLRILASIATHLGRAVGATVENVVAVDQFERLGSWREGGPRPDPQRLFLAITVDGPAGSSTLRLYLPGACPPKPPADRAPAALPSHLGQVDFLLSACLGATDIPLAELLAIEVGDVIPLSASIDEPVALSAEGRLFARGRLGSKSGSFAVEIEDFAEPDRTD